jgi:dolichol-phosphate mannosyltransferase
VRLVNTQAPFDIVLNVSPTSPDLGIVAPVFNEEDCINDVLDSWIATLEEGIQKSIWKSYEIVLCDDGSTDSTVKQIQGKINSNPNIKIVENDINLGAGISLSRAILSTTSKHLVLMDSDGQFESNQIIDLYKELSRWEAVCGIRKKSSSFTHNIGSKISTKYANLLFKTDIADFNCQLKILPGDFLRASQLRSVRMNYSGEITYLVLNSNFSTLWIEVNHQERVSGKSKTKFLRDGFARLLFLTYLGIEKKLINKKIIQIGTLFGTKL